jgi:manganese efflux pump family protein
VISIILLAVALAMDAFAVALIQGATGRLGVGGALRIALMFGLAQGAMPLIGWGLGAAFGAAFQAVDHWIAFLLLAVLGGRMLMEGFRKEPAEPEAKRLFLFSLLVSALATSIDAAAAGLTLPLLGQPIPIACLVIGLTTVIISFGGVILGKRAGVRMGKHAEVIGGLLLIGLGLKILLDHRGLI